MNHGCNGDYMTFGRSDSLPLPLSPTETKEPLSSCQHPMYSTSSNSYGYVKYHKKYFGILHNDKTPLAAPLCIVRVLLCISSAIQTTAGYDRDHSKQLPWQVTRILRGSLFALVVLSYYACLQAST